MVAGQEGRDHVHQCPGGLPDASWSLGLTRHWLDRWQAETSTLPSTWNAGAAHPLVLVPWWFFLLSLGNYGAWKTLWRAQSKLARIDELMVDVTVPRLPNDRRWQRPMPWDAWSAGVSLLAHSQELPPEEIATYCLAIVWRVAWWELWRHRAPSLPGATRPWWGLFRGDSSTNLF